MWARSLRAYFTSGEIVPAKLGRPVFLEAEQLWRVANVYDTVAADKFGVPFPQRLAFTRKAKRLRMLARIAAKIEATGAVKPVHELASRRESSTPTNFEYRQVKHRSLAERLEAARAAAAASAGGQKKDQPVENHLNHPFCIT